MLFRIMLQGFALRQWRPRSNALARRHERFSRRKLKNVSINRPETTNLNHQYAIRRVFIYPALAADWLLPAYP
jgi:hypothetical protein